VIFFCITEYCGGQIREDEISGAYAIYWEKRNAYRVLVGKPEEKRPVGRSKRRWENNIKMYLKELGSQDVKWICVVQVTDRWRAVVNLVYKLRVP
jgi:hypothetical protein